MDLTFSSAEQLESLLYQAEQALCEVQRRILLDEAREQADAEVGCGPESWEGFIDRANYNMRSTFHSRRREYERVLQDLVLDKLPRPHGITLRELSRLFFEHMIVKDDKRAEAFDHFRSAAKGLAEDDRRTKPFAIARLPRGPKKAWDSATLEAICAGKMTGGALKQLTQQDEKRGLDTIEPGTELWGPTVYSGPVLKIAGCLSSEYSGERDPGYKSNEMLVYAALSGEMSPAAARYLTGEFKRVVRSICKSYELLFFTQTPERSRLAPLDEDDVGLWCSFIRRCLDHYYIATPQKGTVSRRMQNAIHLLVDADRQHRPGIAHALCMTALEALLGEKCSEISNRLAKNTAVLLEPDKSLRAQARQGIKKLYDKRCRTLHGEDLTVDEQTLRGARLLCAATLKAFIDWSHYERSFVGTDNPAKELFKELERASDHGDRVDGISDLPSVRRLWRQQAD